jgi:hypothetical protein
MQRLPEICAALRVQPEIGAVAKDAAENKSRIGGNDAAITAEFIDVLSRQAGSFCKVRLANAERLHKLFREYLSGGCGFSLCHQHKWPICNY